MPGPTEQTTSVSISTSGRKLGILNLDFVISILGGLQILAIILGLLVTILLGYSMSLKVPGGYAGLAGLTFYAIILLVSFWCLLTTGAIYLSSAVSMITAALLPKTVFFLVYNAMAAAFYLICSIACLGKVPFSLVGADGNDIKSIVISAAVMGIAAGVAHSLITIVGLFKFRGGAVSS